MDKLDERNDKILRKVRRLLALSENNPNEEEAQSAFVMAQRLMIENDLSMSEIEMNSGRERKIDKGKVTIHKKLFWWERQLANIMSRNFRVKSYLNNRYMNSRNIKRAVYFMGFESDVKLAKEMYLLAYEAILHYSNIYVENYYEERIGLYRERRITMSVKNSYMRGFLEGLSNKFDEQIEQMKSEGNALMVLVPKEVEKKYEEEITGEAKPYRIPSIEEIHAYKQGFEDGNHIDYTKSTIKGEKETKWVVYHELRGYLSESEEKGQYYSEDICSDTYILDTQKEANLLCNNYETAIQIEPELIKSVNYK